MLDATKIMKRHPKNPLITPDCIPGTYAVFNPSPVMYQDKTILALSIYPHDMRKFEAGGIYIAASDDGIHFDIRHEKPFIDISSCEYPFSLIKGIFIDCRITKIEDTYYILTPMSIDGEGPFAVMGSTKDFETYTPIEIVSLPSNRGSSLFPEKINGQYYRLERPTADSNHPGSIWISSSPDLIHWGCYRPILQPGYSIWNIIKIGPTPPIKTKDGWLVVIHGVTSWMHSDYHYHIGAVLLDLENPNKVIGRTRSYLLAPETDYEINGIVDNVCFPCGAIGDLEKDELRIYYGGADKCICLAAGALSEVVEACKREL
ncbi:MAG: glycoside hydrolase family 130 protein [Oscillospiraceae bacterium]|nr:glycoside hydrolase family 130 protein [Oscillospiraceae bacterium]